MAKPNRATPEFCSQTLLSRPLACMCAIGLSLNVRKANVRWGQRAPENQQVQTVLDFEHSRFWL